MIHLGEHPTKSELKFEHNSSIIDPFKKTYEIYF